MDTKQITPIQAPAPARHAATARRDDGADPSFSVAFAEALGSGAEDGAAAESPQDSLTGIGFRDGIAGHARARPHAGRTLTEDERSTAADDRTSALYGMAQALPQSMPPIGPHATQDTAQAKDLRPGSTVQDESAAAKAQAAEIAASGRMLPERNLTVAGTDSNSMRKHGSAPVAASASVSSSAFHTVASTLSSPADSTASGMPHARSSEPASASAAAPSTAWAAGSAVQELARQSDPPGHPAAQPVAVRQDLSGLVAPAYAVRPASREASLSPRVGEPGWGEALGNRVLVMAGKREQVAELHLNPPDLGPLKIVLTLSGDQASAQFISPHAPVRDAVEQALPRLHQMLGDNGITLGNAGVSAETFRQQAGQDPGNSARPMPAHDDAPLPLLMSAPMRVLQGLVDTFA